MKISKPIEMNVNGYIIYLEYEAIINSHDDIDIEYNILGGVNEIEIINKLYSNISEADFQDKVVELIDQLRMFCYLDAEAEYINKTVDMLKYNEER